MEDRMTAQQLKNSILQMAVQGKLVSQDPNDEPASVLLERIRKEKEQLIKDGKIKKNKKESYIFRGADNLHYERVGKDVRCIEDELPFEIPDSWQWCRFNQLLKLTSGQDLTADKFNSACKGTPYITGASNLENGSVIINRWTTEPKSFAYSGDLLLTCKGTIGKLAFLTVEKAHIARQIMSIASPYKIDLCYIKIILELDIINLKAKAKSMIPGISRDDVLSILIPVPPINEQNRIVNCLNLLEPLIQKYKKAEEQLFELNSTIKEQLKKSILQYAIEGKLIPQDPNDEPASVLLDRIRKEKQNLIAEGKIKKDKNESIIYRRDNSYYEKLNGFEHCIDDELPFEIPNNWCWTHLNSIGEWKAGSTPSKANIKYYRDGNIPWLLTGDLNNGIITDIPSKITNLALEKTSVKLNPTGTILIAMYGATIGKLGILSYPSTTNQACCACEVIPPFYNMYLFYFLMANKVNFIKQGEGGAQPNISREKIIKTFIPIPPLNEQYAIVNRLRQITKLL